MASEYLAVDPGYVCGIEQDGIGYRNGEPLITLHMEAYLGAPESYDAVEISGSPAFKMKIAGGVHGDIATTSIAVNSLPKILEARRDCTRCATCRCRRSSAESRRGQERQDSAGGPTAGVSGRALSGRCPAAARLLRRGRAVARARGGSGVCSSISTAAGSG